MNILVFGSLNIDFLYSVDHIVKHGETISSVSFAKSAGGKGANQAAALAKAGLPVYMAGKIGGDGKFLTELLKSYGVNTNNVIQYDGATGHAIIQIDKNGQNSIVLYSGGNGEITAEEIKQTILKFKAGDIVVLQNEISNINEIMKTAKKQGIKICLNPSPFNENIFSLPLETVEWFFVNEIEGSALAGMQAVSEPEESNFFAIIKKLTKLFPGAQIILTAGKKGAFYGSGETILSEGIIDVPVIDTTAAGDTFTGYFLAAQSRNLSLQQVLKTACKAASITVSRKGAMETIPSAAEVFN